MPLTLQVEKDAIEFLDEIEEILKRNLNEGERELILRAYAFAKYAHEGDYRASGDPFIEHPKEVARILARLGVDIPSIVAGLLHDTVEDSHGKITLEMIKEDFGEEIARIVDGVTKVSRINAPVEMGKAKEKLETIQKMLFAMAEDMRVIFVKLADRLHNMRTIDFVKDEEKKKYKAQIRDLKKENRRLANKIKNMEKNLEKGPNVVKKKQKSPNVDKVAQLKAKLRKEFGKQN